MSDNTVESVIIIRRAAAGATTALNMSDLVCFPKKDILASLSIPPLSSAEVPHSLPATGGFLIRSEKSYPPKRNFPGEWPRIGVFVCSCGADIAGVVDADLVAAYAKTLAHVIWVENNPYTCSADTRNLIARRIGENNLNRIVIAACAQAAHEAQFLEMVREAGLDDHLVEMADIRGQNTPELRIDTEKATEMAMDQVRVAVQTAVHNATPKQRAI